ncbi:kinase-like protein [Exidia glandulosa HHB12029]|uniref:Kinase-like protein n=1 Tax=Exidia glandulosa HHB12029 TaxID=1314781 RepID=A0A165JKK1_EXIGL|nr:kinase-like protein [Exidia glandulosa HHB12029]
MPSSFDAALADMYQYYEEFDLTHELYEVSGRARCIGGYADIHDARWQPRGYDPVKVALKLLRINPRPEASEEEATRIVKRLKQEISVWRRLSHPNVQELCGLWWNTNYRLPAMVSTWEVNDDISNLARRRRSGADTSLLSLSLLIDVINGLIYLHSMQVVHADLKAANVLISATGRALLCDFGVAWTRVESGLPPYASLNDAAVVLALSRQELPHQPDNMDDMRWELVLFCCVFDARQRPSAEDVLIALRSLHNACEVQSTQRPAFAQTQAQLLGAARSQFTRPHVRFELQDPSQGGKNEYSAEQYEDYDVQPRGQRHVPFIPPIEYASPQSGNRFAASSLPPINHSRVAQSSTAARTSGSPKPPHNARRETTTSHGSTCRRARAVITAARHGARRRIWWFGRLPAPCSRPGTPQSPTRRLRELRKPVVHATELGNVELGRLYNAHQGHGAHGRRHRVSQLATANHGTMRRRACTWGVLTLPRVRAQMLDCSLRAGIDRPVDAEPG